MTNKRQVVVPLSDWIQAEIHIRPLHSSVDAQLENELLTGAIRFSHICSPRHRVLSAAATEELTHLNTDSITLATGSRMKAIRSPFAVRSLNR